MFHLILNITLYLNVENLQPACTHASDLLHALVSLGPAQFQATPSATDMIWNHHSPSHHTHASGKSLGRKKAT